MAHPFSTQTLGNLDLPHFTNGNHHGNSSYTTIPHEWMMNGRIVEKDDYGSPSGRDGLGHGVEIGYRGRSWWGGRIGDWKGGDANVANGGTFLEHCRAKDCFFGCGTNHSPQMEYVEDYDSRGIGGRYVIDGQQEGAWNNEMDHGVGNRCIPSCRYPRSPGLDSGSQAIGLGFHGRHASVPSSPTQPLPSRHRRLSEPFNVLAVDYFSSKPSIPGSPISAGSDDHGSGKFKDNSKPILFKTELCRSWEEKGSCRYGNKCQFAHSPAELRPVPRHPKYKTQLCKTFLEVGSCNYGSRCCFMHSTSRVERQSPKASGVSTPGEMFP